MLDFLSRIRNNIPVHIISQCWKHRVVVSSQFCVLQEAASIVSLVCGTNKIAWTHVDRGMTVLDWQKAECPNFLRGTYMASAYLSDVSTNV